MSRRFTTFSLAFLLFLQVGGCNYPEVPFIPTIPDNADGKPHSYLEFYGRMDTRSTSWHQASDSTARIFQFDKNDYPNACSIIFEANFRTLEPNKFVEVRLFNLTQLEVVPTTHFIHQNLELIAYQSENILPYLPNGPVDLAIQLRSVHGQPVATGWRSYLRIN